MSKLLERLKDQLKEYGKTNDFANGFELLGDITVEEGKFKMILDQLHGRFDSFKKAKIKGTIDQEELRLVENRIRDQFLSSVSELQEKDLAIYWSRRDSTPVKRNRIVLVLLSILLGAVLFFAGRMMGISTRLDDSEIKDSLIVAQRQLERQTQKNDSLATVNQEYQDQLKGLPDDDSMRQRWIAAAEENRNLKREITKLKETNNSLVETETRDDREAKPCPPLPNNYYSGTTLVVHGSVNEQVRRKLAFAGIYVTNHPLPGNGRSITHHPENERAASYLAQLIAANYQSLESIKPVSDSQAEVNEIHLHH